MTVQPQGHVAAMNAYALSRINIPAGVEPVPLNQNESAFPPSPNAIEAAAQVAAGSHLYSDPDWTDLRAAIADLHGIDPSRILVGAGSMELIAATIAAFTGPGNDVLSTQFGYAFFASAARAVNAGYAAAPERDRAVCVDSILHAVTPATRAVCVANPGNPTGTRVDSEAVRRLRAELPDNVLLILDEAYAEFTDHLGEPMFDLVDRGDTVVLRTFSKAYSLAGMRVGWGVFPPVVALEVRKLLNPNNVSSASQAAATAAMRDQAYKNMVVETTAVRRDVFADQCRDLGLDVLESHTNFLLLGFGSADRAAQADAVLRQRGVVVRPMDSYGLGDCLRATVGDESAMKQATEALRAWTEMEKTS
ncbi:MAG: histidinol-phosphate transaminase [Alphaproteobacteria bacterium]